MTNHTPTLGRRFIQSIGGLVLSYRSASGATAYSPRATVPAGVVMPAFGFYLLGGAGYAGAVTPDQPMAWTASQGFAASGGHLQITQGGAVLDTVGFNDRLQLTLKDDSGLTE